MFSAMEKITNTKAALRPGEFLEAAAESHFGGLDHGRMMATWLLCKPIGVEGLEVWARCYGICFGFPGECRRDGDGNMVECVFMSYSRLQARIC